MEGSDGGPASRRAVLAAFGAATAGLANEGVATARAAAPDTGQTTGDEPGAPLRWTLEDREKMWVAAVDGLVITHDGVARGGQEPVKGRDVETGDVVWSAVPDAGVAGHHGGLLGASTSSAFVALDPATSEERWRVDLSDYAVDWWVHDGIAFVDVYVGGLVAVDVDDGTVLERVTGEFATRTVWPAGESRVVAFTSDLLAVLDGEDGSVRWRYEWGDERVQLEHAGDVVLLGTSHELRARSVPDGSDVWRYEPRDGDRFDLIGTDDEVAVLAEPGAALVAVALDDGSEAWRSRMPVTDPDSGTPPAPPAHVGTDGTVYALTSEDELRSLDAGSGETRWSVDVGGDQGVDDWEWDSGEGVYLGVGSAGIWTLHRLDGGDDGPRWSASYDENVDVELPDTEHLLVVRGGTSSTSTRRLASAGGRASSTAASPSTPSSSAAGRCTAST